MRILLTGASGLVGAAFARAAAARGHEVIGLVGGYRGAVPGLSLQRSIDLADLPAASRAVLDVAPDAIANCAAISVPEACEAEPERSRMLNVALPERLARLAHQIGARLVHLSSEQVFDGRQTEPYTTSSPVAPINLYGRQKRESERAVCAHAPDLGVTLRAPLLMGDSLGGKRGVHERLFLDWAAGRKPRLFVDEFRQPCTAANLAGAMLEVMTRDDLWGVFHWAGAEVISRHALGLRIREHFKLTEKQAPIIAVRHADVSGAAEKRQPRLALALDPLAQTLTTKPQTMAEQLAELHVPASCRDEI